MSHNIESIAWTNEKPWHGIGTEVKPNISVDAMLKAANLDWTVSKRAMQDVDGTPVEGFFSLRRDSDNKLLDVTGPDYTPVQNKPAFQFFDSFLKQGKATMEVAGSLNGGKMVWGLAKLGAGFALPGKDRVDYYLLAVIPHVQGKTLQFMSTATRVVCQNTIQMALKAGSANLFKHIHRAEFTEATMEEAQRVITASAESFAMFREHAETLAKKKMSQAASIDYLAAVFEPDEPVAEVLRKPSRPLQQAIAALTHAPGHDLASSTNTAWGALNAVTYTVDHLMGKKVDRRLTRAWLGKTATLKRTALDLALSA